MSSCFLSVAVVLEEALNLLCFDFPGPLPFSTRMMLRQFVSLPAGKRRPPAERRRVGWGRDRFISCLLPFPPFLLLPIFLREDGEGREKDLGIRHELFSGGREEEGEVGEHDKPIRSELCGLQPPPFLPSPFPPRLLLVLLLLRVKYPCHHRPTDIAPPSPPPPPSPSTIALYSRSHQISEEEGEEDEEEKNLRVALTERRGNSSSATSISLSLKHTPKKSWEITVTG